MSRPRIRTIKPEFFDSESIGSMPIPCRLLFIGLWVMADDEGRIRASSRRVRKVVFGFDDDVTVQDVDGWLRMLTDRRKIQCYEVDGYAYIAICGWSRHQKINRKSPSLLPVPPTQKQFTEDSLNTHGGLTPHARADPDPDPDPEYPLRVRARDTTQANQFLEWWADEFEKHHRGPWVPDPGADVDAALAIVRSARGGMAEAKSAVLRMWSGERRLWAAKSTSVRGAAELIHESLTMPPLTKKDSRRNGKPKNGFDWRQPYDPDDRYSGWGDCRANKQGGTDAE